MSCCAFKKKINFFVDFCHFRPVVVNFVDKFYALLFDLFLEKEFLSPYYRLIYFSQKTRFKNIAFLGMSAHSGSRSRTRRNESAQLEPMRASTHRGQLLLIFRVKTLILRKSPRDYKLEKLTFFSQLYLRFRVKISKEIQIFEF